MQSTCTPLRMSQEGQKEIHVKIADFFEAIAKIIRLLFIIVPSQNFSGTNTLPSLPLGARNAASIPKAAQPDA